MKTLTDLKEELHRVNTKDLDEKVALLERTLGKEKYLFVNKETQNLAQAIVFITQQYSAGNITRDEFDTLINVATLYFWHNLTSSKKE